METGPVPPPPREPTASVQAATGHRQPMARGQSPPIPGGSAAPCRVVFHCHFQKILRFWLQAPLPLCMPGQEHAGLAEELPAGGLPKDEQCQAPSCFQRSTSQSRRFLQAGPQHLADPGEPAVGEDTQHTPLCRGRAKRLLPVAKQLRCHGSDPNSPGVVSPQGAASWNCAPSSASCTHGLEGRQNSHGKGSTRVTHPAALKRPVLLGKGG